MSQSYGKFIITGEHSVVYGETAIVSSLKKTIDVEVIESKNNPKRTEYDKYIFDIFSKIYRVDPSKLLIKVNSKIPQMSGLGSSAAYAHALLKALAKYFRIKVSKDEMFNLVLDSEVFVHKKPSGIDPCAVVYGGVHKFKKNLDKGEFEIEKINLKNKYNFLLINSGKALESTGDMVSIVAGKLQQNPSLENVIKKIGKLSEKIHKELVSGEFSGKLLRENQALLENLGVVGESAKKMIDEIQKIGVYAKITGSGGVESGSGWILAYANDFSNLKQLCIQNSWENIETEVK